MSRRVVTFVFTVTGLLAPALCLGGAPTCAYDCVSPSVASVETAPVAPNATDCCALRPPASVAVNVTEIRSDAALPGPPAAAAPSSVLETARTGRGSTARTRGGRITPFYTLHSTLLL